MEPIEQPQGPLPTHTPTSPFSTLATSLYAAAWLLVMFQGWGAHIGSDPTSWLRDPAATASRVIHRDLELAAAMERLESGRELRRNLYGTFDEVLEASISIQDDVTRNMALQIETGRESAEQLQRANALQSVLLAEAGRLDESLELAGAYRGNEIKAAQSGLANSLRSEEGAERGARLLRRSDMMTAANMLLIVGGALVLIALARGTTRARPSTALVVPWSMELGFAVMVRADFWNRLYFVTLSILGETRLLSERAAGWLDPFYTWGSLIASLPMLWLVYRHLLSPLLASGVSRTLLEPLGLRVRSLRMARIARITGAVVAVNFLGTTALAWGSFWLGFEGHWAEGLDETLIWGSTREALETGIDYVVLTPVFEEILFRGLLFFTLRNRFGAWNAALLSSAFFSAVHFYSLPGFLMTFWSGFIWAIAFERARSLLPGIVAHGVYNLFFVAGIWLIYR